ncbi:disease resistance protein RPV1-like [Rhododendron vialii]|uniref:disease resistance protein RPV1-like n=1 Tax=Rhododendron vialii TaxID=182163 RepID=UPI0026604FCC|nr:disease resistance protein RPV1-like [Rhododendron vialii]
MMTTVKSQEAASSSTPHCHYHVFLSFRSKDTRKTFTDHLYTALVRAGFRTFRDDDEIRRGENMMAELQKAIQESKISIVVLSKTYASSSWCLDELVMILRRRKTSVGTVVLPVFYDVDPSHVRKQMGTFKEAFNMHEDRIEAETGESKTEWKSKVEEWRGALREVADLAGMNLQSQADGHEARFIEKIIQVVGEKLRRSVLYVAPHPIGIHTRAKSIQLWLEDGSTDVGIVAICGTGGIGKTTIAKFLYNQNFSKFEGSSFLANVREIAKQQDGFLRLQKQLLSDVLQGRKEKIYNRDEGIVRIKDTLCCKRVLVVLDDVDRQEQVEAVLGMRDWLFPGSKIIITTRHERLLWAHEVCKVHRVEELDFNESLELFSWHAFGKSYPVSDYVEVSERVVQYCGGIPLAIKVLGSSLSGKSLNIWKSQLEKLKAIPDREILEKLRISYDSLQDDHNQKLFLHLACFFVGMDKDQIVTILDVCEFYTVVGIQNLIDRCLCTIDERNTLVIHQLLQDMGREIVRQESPDEPGERSILWSHMDSFNVLRENTGTSKIEGLVLDMHLVNRDNSSRTISNANRKRRFEEFLEPLLSNLGNAVKRCRSSIFPSHMAATAPENSNQVALDANAFARMRKLKLLQLNHVRISGPYRNLPKGLRWLYWRGFPLKSIPGDFPMEDLVALDMHYSNLKNVWDGTKILKSLKILNLSDSHNLTKTPDFSALPNLERLMLKNCSSLYEVDESIGCLERLALLDLEGCENLRKLPRGLGMLKFLETLVISRCSNLEELPTEIGNMGSLTVLHADGIDINRVHSTTGEAKAPQSLIRHGLLKPRKSLQVCLPRSLVKLRLANCNLSDDAFPKDLSNLISLKLLDLSQNPICNLPEGIRGLTGLEILHLSSCTSLRTLILIHKLRELWIGRNPLLENITVPSASHRPTTTYFSSSLDNLVGFKGPFKLEPIGDVDTEILTNLGLSNLGSMENTNAKLITTNINKPEMLPIQGCPEDHIFTTFLPGSKVPLWYNFRCQGSSISFTAPSHRNSRLQALSVCAAYRISYDKKYSRIQKYPHTTVSSTNKGVMWSYCPRVFGIPEAGDDMMWLSYWKFEQLEGGDELTVSVDGGEFMQAMEVGVYLVYKDVEHEEKSTRSVRGEEIYQRTTVYGNVVPGIVSAHSVGTKLYQVGHHWDGFKCEYCPRGVAPFPWTLSAAYDDEIKEPFCFADMCKVKSLGC